MNHDFSKTLFRASGCSQLMTEPKSKAETISETTKTFLVGVMISELYDRHKDVMNKYVQKGLMVEEDAITLFSRFRKQFYQKNELHLENDFLKGTPDLFEGEETILRATKIIDIKSSFDIFTFFKSKYDPVNKDYFYQLQAYMDLTGATESELAYCLVDTPDSIIEGIKRRFMWDAGIKGEDEFDHKVFEEIERLAKYDDIPIEKRHHIKIIPRDQDAINKLHEKVILARQWMNENFNS
jgi:hypothetical protein